MKKTEKQYVRKNVALKIEYDGLEFAGWQRQPVQPTVQQAIEDAISSLMNRKVVVYGAGRTDSGVSARCQVANFWGDDRFREKQWALALNFILPRSIRIVESQFLADSFHAQKCAQLKRYEYRILNRSCPSALDRHVYFYPNELDWDRIKEAMEYFVGTHDFASFQAAKGTTVTTVRTITRMELIEEGDGFMRIDVEGTGFLKQMVRSLVGTLMEVGEGKREPHEMPYILNALDRRQAGRTMPAHGLCLAYVEYPEEFGLWQPQQLKGRYTRPIPQVFIPEVENDGYTVN